MKQENLNFKKGYDQVQKRHLKTVREEIEKACGFKFERTTFYSKMKGKLVIKATEFL